MKPTPAELKAEIESGPLAATLAAPWALGHDLTVADLLNATTTGRTQQVARVMSLTELATLGGIDPASVLAVFKHDRFAEFRDTLNKQDVPGAVAFATLFAADGTITQDDLKAFTAYATGTVTETCSRAAERGWDAVSHLEVADARKVGA